MGTKFVCARLIEPGLENLPSASVSNSTRNGIEFQSQNLCILQQSSARLSLLQNLDPSRSATASSFARRPPTPASLDTCGKGWRLGSVKQMGPGQDEPQCADVSTHRVALSDSKFPPPPTQVKPTGRGRDLDKEGGGVGEDVARVKGGGGRGGQGEREGRSER